MVMENPALSVINQITTNSSQTRDKHLEERRRDAIVCICIELAVAIAGFGIALRSYLITTNMKAGAFWSHIALLLACLFLLIGVCLQQQGKAWMIMGMVSNVIGILMAFIGTLVDGAQAGHISQTKFSDCSFSQEKKYVPCFHSGPAENYNCEMLVYENSCYCCYIFRENHCDTWGFSLSTRPNLFRGVTSCAQVEEEYQVLLWTSMACNLVQFIVATVTVSLVGRYKSLLSQMVHPSTVLVSPSMIGNTVGVTTGPLVIFNQHTVGYYPHMTSPPDYSEAVGVGPPPPQPGSMSDSIDSAIPSTAERNTSQAGISTINCKQLPRTSISSIHEPPPAFSRASVTSSMHGPPPAFSRAPMTSSVHGPPPAFRRTSVSSIMHGPAPDYGREESLPPPYSP